MPNALDPCALVTAAEASSLAGATFGSGKEDTTSGGGKMCLYGGQTLNVFTVIVAQAADAATAQAEWEAQKGKVQAQLEQGAPSGAQVSFTIDDVSNVTGADRAAAGTGKATISGQTISASVIFMLKGPVFVSFSDLKLGASAPSVSAMEAQATTTLTRVP